jgi:hypothetical protein
MPQDGRTSRRVFQTFGNHFAFRRASITSYCRVFSETLLRRFQKYATAVVSPSVLPRPPPVKGQHRTTGSQLTGQLQNTLKSFPGYVAFPSFHILSSAVKTKLQRPQVYTTKKPQQ